MKTIRNFVLLINALFFISTILENLTYAQEGKLIRDTWTRSTMGEDEIGWTHEVVFEIVKEGRTQYKSKNDVVMEFKRFGQGVTISMESWALENEEGSILEMHQKSMMSGQATLYDLVVEGEKACLTITTMGTPRKSEIDWNAETIGTMGIWKLRQKKGNVPGIEYSYKAFLFEYMQTVKMSIKLEDYEETELLDNAKAKLFRAINTIDLLPGVNTIEWWSDDFITQKTSVKMMGLSMESFHTTKERAMKEGNSELKGDVILETMAKSNINIPVPYKLDSILYRFIPKDPAIGLPKNMNRLNQKVLEQNEKEAIVRISAVVPESAQSFPIRNPPPELMEYLEANAYIQCDHPPLQQKALDIVKDAKDAWQAACLLENFVFTYIKDKNFGTGFASAAEVFENPCGDCSEHGVLLVAMCRAVGIPSRVAMGYMYLGGIFGGHMWAEVWMEGKWYPIDGVMGIGRVDPTHITFTDTSLHNGGLSQAFASAITGLGNIDLQIIEFSRGDQTIKVGEEGFKDYSINNNTFTNTLYGISIAKPDGYIFADYIKNYAGPDFKLLDIKGTSEAKLEALPAVFSFSFDGFKKRLEARGLTVTSESQKEVGNQPAKLFRCVEKNNGKNKTLVMAVIYHDTCYFLTMKISNDESDIATFEFITNSIRFLN